MSDGNPQKFCFAQPCTPAQNPESAVSKDDSSRGDESAQPLSSVGPSQKPRSAMTRLEKEREKAKDEIIARIVLPQTDRMRGRSMCMSDIVNHMLS